MIKLHTYSILAFRYPLYYFFTINLCKISFLKTDKQKFLFFSFFLLPSIISCKSDGDIEHCSLYKGVNNLT